MDVAARHESALRRMLQVDAPSVEFVVEDSDYDPTTDQPSNENLIVVKGHAVQLTGDPIEYQGMYLVDMEPITLLFIPDEMDDEPSIDAKILWNDKVHRVRKVHPFRFNGRFIGGKVIAV